MPVGLTLTTISDVAASQLLASEFIDNERFSSDSKRMSAGVELCVCVTLNDLEMLGLQAAGDRNQ